MTTRREILEELETVGVVWLWPPARAFDQHGPCYGCRQSVVPIWRVVCGLDKEAYHGACCLPRGYLHREDEQPAPARTEDLRALIREEIAIAPLLEIQAIYEERGGEHVRIRRPVQRSVDDQMARDVPVDQPAEAPSAIERDHGSVFIGHRDDWDFLETSTGAKPKPQPNPCAAESPELPPAQADIARLADECCSCEGEHDEDGLCGCDDCKLSCSASLLVAAVWRAVEQPKPEAPSQHPAVAEFKRFHKRLCERFGYGHDDKDWRRDQLSLEEWIAKKIADAHTRIAELEALPVLPIPDDAKWRAEGPCSVRLLLPRERDVRAWCEASGLHPAIRLDSATQHRLREERDDLREQLRASREAHGKTSGRFAEFLRHNITLQKEDTASMEKLLAEEMPF